VSAARPLAVLVCAVGGQGGGVLAEWLGEAAFHAGYRAQATSIPGVAQRTGATTYYIELSGDREGAQESIFCLFPSAGNVDVVVALEPIEAARALQNGYIGNGTTVVTAAARVYAIGEKILAGDGTTPASVALEALRRAAKDVIVVDGALDESGSANARIFGALAAAGALPLSPEDCRRAIAGAGIAPELNLAEFERGLHANPREQKAPRGADAAFSFAPAPAGFENDVTTFPERHRPLIAHALARLVDYQDEAYARRYLTRLQHVARIDFERAGEHGSEAALTGIVARRLAAWMTFEDAIRVAQIKTRPGRLARIRAEAGAGRDEPLDVVDFLTPSWDDARAMLPEKRSTAARPQAFAPETRAGRPIKLRTSGPVGYAALKLLSALRPLRPSSARFAREQRAIDAWLATILATAPSEYALACRLAELASLARGYGASGAGGAARLAGLLSSWEVRLRTDGVALANEAAALLEASRHDPDAAFTRA
jgi:indolepyruvate ferredoxin oxidoreductase beta subunit